MNTRRIAPIYIVVAACAFVGSAFPACATPVFGANGDPAAAGGLDTTSTGPVRMARFSVVEGDVTWRPDATTSWSPSDVNLPIRQGSQISVARHAHAEIQFDDGSVVRLGAGAVLTLQTLYSDADGEFTELKLTAGLATVKIRNSVDLFQIDTPYVSTKITGPARVRFGVSSREEIGVKSGRAKIEGPQGAVTLNSGDFLDIPDYDSAYNVSQLPPDDSWEQWNDSRDSYLDGDSPTKRYAPSNVAIASPDLDDYGDWRNVSGYGEVWCPHVSASWRPYYVGHWVWCDPFGWTWVSSEPWGWAPYHYGAWFHCGYGWAWRPGPVHQYWCPAVVNFYETPGGVCWVPLAPAEVYYPSALSCGFVGGSWSLFFSIGGCAVYYPHGPRLCYARPWGNGWVNGYGWGRGEFGRAELVQNAPNRYFAFAANRNGYVSAAAFRPSNAQFGGASIATVAAFRGQGAFQAVPASRAAQIFAGRSVSAPAAGVRPTAGPAGLAPTLQSVTPSRQFVSAPAVVQTAGARSVYRSALRPAVAQATGQAGAAHAGFTGRASNFGEQVRASSSPQPMQHAPSATAAPSNGATSRASAPTASTAARPLTATEQSVIRARGSVGLPARVRSEGDATGVGAAGHTYERGTSPASAAASGEISAHDRGTFQSRGSAGSVTRHSYSLGSEGGSTRRSGSSGSAGSAGSRSGGGGSHADRSGSGKSKP